MLPFEPQPYSELQARYPKALEELTDVSAGVIPASPPSTRREHVFDFTEGLRLIVSRDKFPDGQIYIHISASVMIKDHKWGVTKFATIAKGRIKELTGLDTARSTISALSPGKGIPHWMWKQD